MLGGKGSDWGGAVGSDWGRVWGSGSTGLGLSVLVVVSCFWVTGIGTAVAH